MNCDVIVSDVTVSDVIITEANSDVILRDVEVNKPIAGKRYSQQHSFLTKKGFIRSSLSMCSKTFTKMALILAIVIRVFGSMFNTKLPERISEIGTSSSFAPSTPRDGLGFLDSSVLSILRESSTTIIGINEGLCSCINRGTFLNNNKQLIRRMKVLQNTIMREERDYVYPGYATYALATFARDVCAGKRLGIYIFPSADFCTFPVYYLDTYTVNLELDDDFTVFYNLIYLYIYNVYRSWASCNWATYPEAILVKMYTLVYFSSKVIVLMIKSQFWKLVYFSPLSIVLERVATSGDPLGRSYKRGH